jgi:hypothetical protein
MSGTREKAGSFVKDNIGGIIFSVIIVIIVDIIGVSSLGAGKGRYIAISILHIPLVFIAWTIGNVIRKALHPSFVIANGFWGLLKERFFWRFGPQLILSIIVLAIAVNITQSFVTKSVTKDIATRFEKEFEIQPDNVNGNNEQSSPYFEITKDQFVQFYANGNEFVETDVERCATMISRGNEYLHVTGNITRELLLDIYRAAAVTEKELANEGVFLDFSDVKGFAALDMTSIGSPYGVNTIVLGEDFSEINRSYFHGSPIRNIYIPNTVKKIGEYAFESCSNLEGIVIPPSVTEIGNGAFWYCRNMAFVLFSKDSQIKVIGNAFGGSESLFNFTMPQKLEILGDNFSYSPITSLVFPETITSIGELGADNLTEVVIYAENPPKVKDNSFPKSITNIYVPRSSLKVYEDAWFDYEFTFHNQLKAMD